jgi:ATP-binding cassette subfamily G (WHITE) protein 2
MQALARLTEENKLTVLATVHQPRKKLFDLFHNVTLMQSGDVVYQGHTRGAVRYFASAGYPSLGQGNPADHILDVLATTEISSGKKVPRLQREVDLSLGADYPDLPVRKKTRWIEQFYILFRRAVHQNVRNWHLHLANFICVILVTFFVGYGPWDHIPPTPEKVGLYPAVLFYCAIHQGLVYSYQGINAFPRERAIMIRERQNGAYQVSTYFLSKTLADSIFQLPSPIIFSLLVYHQVGLQDTAHKFGTFIWLLILTAQAAVAMTNMISCIFLSIESTVVVIAISFEITRLFGGWFVPPILITSQYSAWKFQDALSYLKYGFIGISLNQYRGLNLLCTPAQLANPKVICTGEQYLATFGLEQYTVSECAGYLIVLILGFRLLSYLALRFIKL